MEARDIKLLWFCLAKKIFFEEHHYCNTEFDALKESAFVIVVYNFATVSGTMVCDTSLSGKGILHY